MDIQAFLGGLAVKAATVHGVPPTVFVPIAISHLSFLISHLDNACSIVAEVDVEAADGVFVPVIVPVPVDNHSLQLEVAAAGVQLEALDGRVVELVGRTHVEVGLLRTVLVEDCGREGADEVHTIGLDVVCRRAHGDTGEYGVDEVAALGGIRAVVSHVVVGLVPADEIGLACSQRGLAGRAEIQR